MADTLTAPAPAAGSPIIVAAPPAKPVPAPTSQINVSSLPKGDPAPVKPGSGMDRLRQDLRKKFGGEEPATSTPAAAKPAAATDKSSAGVATAEGADSEAVTASAADGEAGSALTDPASSADPAAAATTSAANDPKNKKLSPWKLVDQFKARATAAEAKALELEKQVLPEAKRKELSETLQRQQTQIKEMEADLRFFNAEKYDPDIKAANASYETAWKRALSELSEITLTDPNTQQTRAVVDSDLLELVNLPLGKAREIADQYFGVFADDVMAHRKEIRNLFEAKSAKLKELKETGGQRDQERQSQYQAQMQAVQKQVKELYEAANQEAVKHEKFGAFFKEREGDSEWNKRLQDGFQLVDKALNENSLDPRLTPEQRAAIVKRHAAVRNRAASWGPLRYQNEQLTAKIAALEKDLAAYKTSTPAAGGTSSNAPATPLSGMAALRAGLQKIAVPG